MISFFYFLLAILCSIGLISIILWLSLIFTGRYIYIVYKEHIKDFENWRKEKWKE